jgi:ElaB/YqjD/DUF883 family membrane-anchored ribosome-binding protein
MDTTASPIKSGTAKLESKTTNTAGPGLNQAGSKPLANEANGIGVPAKQAVDRFSKAAHGAVDSLSDVLSRGSDASSKAFETSKTFVKDKPVAAVGIALAVGLVVGRLTLS